jgi:hypothetical protein
MCCYQKQKTEYGKAKTNITKIKLKKSNRVEGVTLVSFLLFLLKKAISRVIIKQH